MGGKGGGWLNPGCTEQFCIRKHNKDSKKMETMKKMLIYLLERLDKEEAGKRITIIFDSEGAGLSNFDLEQVKFLIHVLISYYPNFVEKILVNIHWLRGYFYTQMFLRCSRCPGS